MVPHGVSPEGGSGRIENACGGITGRSPSFGDHPLSTADEEARPAIPFPWACGAVFKLSWEYLGPLGSIFGCLGVVLGGSWELLGRSWGGLGGSWGDLAVTFRAVQFSIHFFTDFGRPRGAKREAFWEPKWSKIHLESLSTSKT